MTSLVKYEVVSKTRHILVVYRDKLKKLKNQTFQANQDHWYFLDLRSAHYGACGVSLDVVFLMDGITQDEFIHHPAFVAIYPTLKKEAVILEAG